MYFKTISFQIIKIKKKFKYLSLQNNFLWKFLFLNSKNFNYGHKYKQTSEKSVSWPYFCFQQFKRIKWVSKNILQRKVDKSVLLLNTALCKKKTVSKYFTNQIKQCIIILPFAFQMKAAFPWNAEIKNKKKTSYKFFTKNWNEFIILVIRIYW